MQSILKLCFAFLALLLCSSVVHAQTKPVTLKPADAFALKRGCDKKNPGFQSNALKCLALAKANPSPCPAVCQSVVTVMNADPICQQVVFQVCPYLKQAVKKSGAQATLGMLNTLCPPA